MLFFIMLMWLVNVIPPLNQKIVNKKEIKIMKKFQMFFVGCALCCFLGCGDEGGSENLYRRYPHPDEMRKQVWDSAKEETTNNVRDPLTGKFMSSDKQWDMGHKPGYEHSKHRKSAIDRALTPEEFKTEYKDPSHYRPELPSSNRSHKLEAPPNVNKYPKPTNWQKFKKGFKGGLKIMSKIL
jgi:hypothetical protein